MIIRDMIGTMDSGVQQRHRALKVAENGYLATSPDSSRKLFSERGRAWKNARGNLAIMVAISRRRAPG
jgi:hypothetical protein